MPKLPPTVLHAQRVLEDGRVTDSEAADVNARLDQLTREATQLLRRRAQASA